MKKILLVLAVILFVSCSQEEKPQEITKNVIAGKVTLADNGNAPVEIFVFYDRFRVDESDLIKKYDANENGEFEITLPEGINYAQLHVVAPGYAAYETKFIAGDEKPFISAELFKTGAPKTADSVEIFIQTKERNFFNMDKIDENTFVWEGELDTNVISYQILFNGKNSQYDNSNETQWKYDYAGDYQNVIKSDDKKYKIEIKLDKFRTFDNPEDRKLTKGEWQNAPANIQYAEIQELLPNEDISQLSPSYYYLVKRGNDAVLGNMPEEKIQELAAQTVNALNKYKKINDSLLTIVSSPYVKDVLNLTKNELLSVTDSSTFNDKLNVMKNLQEIPPLFYDVISSVIYYDDFNKNSDKYLDTLNMIIDRSKDERNKNLIKYNLYYSMERSPELKSKYEDKILKNTQDIIASGNNDSWVKDSGPKLIQKLEVSNLKTAPDFSFKDVAGKDYKLSDFNGKWVLLDFWGTWCGPCRGETPYLVNTFEKFKNKDFMIISISTDREVSTVTEYMKEHNMNWVNTIELDGYSVGAVDKYGVSSFPTLMLIKPNGDFDRSVNEGDLRGESLIKTIGEKLG